MMLCPNLRRLSARLRRRITAEFTISRSQYAEIPVAKATVAPVITEPVQFQLLLPSLQLLCRHLNLRHPHQNQLPEPTPEPELPMDPIALQLAERNGKIDAAANDALTYPRHARRQKSSNRNPSANTSTTGWSTSAKPSSPSNPTKP